jgi:hypothetical protein
MILITPRKLQTGSSGNIVSFRQRFWRVRLEITIARRCSESVFCEGVHQGQDTKFHAMTHIGYPNILQQVANVLQALGRSSFDELERCDVITQDPQAKGSFSCFSRGWVFGWAFFHVTRSCEVVVIVIVIVIVMVIVILLLLTHSLTPSLPPSSRTASKGRAQDCTKSPSCPSIGDLHNRQDPLPRISLHWPLKTLHSQSH